MKWLRNSDPETAQKYVVKRESKEREVTKMMLDIKNEQN